jgi:hypothetical protein
MDRFVQPMPLELETRWWNGGIGIRLHIDFDITAGSLNLQRLPPKQSRLG